MQIEDRLKMIKQRSIKKSKEQCSDEKQFGNKDSKGK